MRATLYKGRQEEPPSAFLETMVMDSRAFRETKAKPRGPQKNFAARVTLPLLRFWSWSEEFFLARTVRQVSPDRPRQEKHEFENLEARYWHLK